MKRKKIEPGEKVPVRMTVRDRELLLEYTLGDLEYADRLRPDSTGKGLIGEYTLDDLEDILGYVAAEANHAEDKKPRRELDALHNRLLGIQQSFDDGTWNDSAASTDSQRK
jgi:hypothetical protein